MYETFYNLKEKPFSIQPDPDFLYFGRRHAYAYAMMEFGIKNGAGFSVLSGEIGCGKTTLIRHLLNDLSASHVVGLVYNTHKDIADLLEWIMLSFGLPYEGKSKVALYEVFQNFLIEQHGLKKRVLLIVDEAQNLNPDALESLRMLSNINADKHQLLQIILVGQPQLKAMLMRPELQQFAQRVAVDFHIKPLDAAEVKNYSSTGWPKRDGNCRFSQPQLVAELQKPVAGFHGSLISRAILRWFMDSLPSLSGLA